MPSDPQLTASDVVRLLGLEAHPEGGHYRETYRDLPPDGGRGACASIYYLLAAGEESVWQSARSTGDWSLVGCTVAPAFQFDGFQLAPPDWRPHD